MHKKLPNEEIEEDNDRSVFPIMDYGKVPRKLPFIF